MQVYLRRKGTYISCATVHKYMKKMQLFSVSRRKKPGYVHGAAHKVYDNRLKQNFHAKKRNRKWCTDFTYLTLADGRKRYNCTIIDLYDRSVIASITDRNITSDLGSQYTSREFTEFCIEKGITQSMSKAGYENLGYIVTKMLDQNNFYDIYILQKLYGEQLKQEVLWNAYQKNYYYAANISWQMVMQSIRFLYKYLITITKGL